MSYKEQIIKKLSGENSADVADKIQKQMKAAFESQLALKKAKTLDLEDAVIMAEEKCNSVIINGGEIVSSRPNVIQQWLDANESLEEAKRDLASHEKDINTLEKGLAIVNG